MFYKNRASILQKPKLFDLDEAPRHFEQFIEQFNKHYDNEEEKEIRFESFKENLKLINDLNSNPNETAHFGITQFADLSEEEQSKGFGCADFPEDFFDAIPVDEPLAVDLGILGDGVEYTKYMTPIKDQQKCASCWAFALTGTLEAKNNMKRGASINLSEQQLLDCTNANCNNGYDVFQASHFLPAIFSQSNDQLLKRIMNQGSTFDDRFSEILLILGIHRYLTRAGGIMGSSDYPYKGIKQRCAFNPAKVKVKLANYKSLQLRDEKAVKTYLTKYGPLAIGVHAEPLLHVTSGGIFQGCRAGRVDHAVVLAGYGTENGVAYWLIRNSWGTSWGNQGYLKIATKSPACNFFSYPGYAPEVV